MEEKNNPENPYSNLPKHLEPFLPPEEAKIKYEKFVPEEITWKDVILEFFKSRFFKISASIIIPIVILNFWIFRYDDWTGGCHIKINISLLEWNNLDIKSALGFISKKSPEDYKKVCTYVDTVSPDLPCGGSGGGCYHDDRPKEIVVSNLGHGKHAEWTAAVIVHETCHAIQKAEERTKGDREKECYRASYKFLKKIGVKDEDIPQNWRVGD
jgi:hypothetical protein